MKNKEYSAQVNDDLNFENLTPGDLDLVVTGDNSFHILKNNRSYEARVLRMDLPSKTFTIQVNDNTYDIQLADHFDRLVKQLGFSSAEQTRIKEIKAPMPGLVLEVKVEAEQQVQKGDTLLILEAMKMENVIKSPGEGTIKIIHVAQGSIVEKGYLMIEME